MKKGFSFEVSNSHLPKASEVPIFWPSKYVESKVLWQGLDFGVKDH